jgi:hypothetical protein
VGFGIVLGESNAAHSFKDISTFIQDFHGKYSFYSYQRDVDFVNSLRLESGPQ